VGQAPVVRMGDTSQMYAVAEVYESQVRYVKAERQGADGEERTTHWIATVQYTYSAPSKDPTVRRWNPLGFRILELVCEPEVLVGTTTATTR